VSLIFDVWTVGVIASLTLAGIAALIAGMNGSFEGWRKDDYRFMFAAAAAFVASPVWPVTLVALLAFLYRRSFPKPTYEDLQEQIRKAEREAGIR
jgi:hypothetical protein